MADVDHAAGLTREISHHLPGRPSAEGVLVPVPPSRSAVRLRWGRCA